MKKKICFKIIKLLTVLLALFNFLMYFSMRCCWSGISKTLGYEKDYNQFIYHLPVIVFFILLILLITTLSLFKFMKKDKILWSLILLPVNFIFTIAVIVIIALGAIDYIYFIWPEFLKITIITALVFGIMAVIFIYPKSTLATNNVFKYSFFGAILLLTVLFVVKFSINNIEYEPVVYVVEDKYQIVFGSSSNALGWIEIDGKRYLDTYAGSEKSETKVHKIEIDMDILDTAKEYTVVTQKFYYRGPFGAIKAREIKKTYSFKPVDTSDGINYYALSDIHMELDAAKKAADKNQDKEFLVLAGDVISMINSHDDAFYTGKIAHELTKGEIPVVYARGNHEVKGKYSEVFYKYVGSKNENFYFNFYIGNIYGIVLDLGEDHDDDWWEYYGTADYASYQNEQVEFLNNELAKKEYENFEYKMVVSHIPLMYINSRGNHIEIKKTLTAIINEFDIDIMLSGHQHDLWVFEPNILTPYVKLPYNKDYKNGTNKGQVTDFNFPAFLISKRGKTQNDSNKLTGHSQIGLTVIVDFKSNTQTVTYNNSDKEKVNIVNPFANYTYGYDIVIDLETKVFYK